MVAGVRAAVAGGSAIAIALSGTAIARADDPNDIYKRAAPATVHVLGNLGSGTGFIYDAEEGLIVTNAHVIQGQASLKVVIQDQKPVPVRLVGSDPCEDIAVLKLATRQPDLKELEFGDSTKLEAGDTLVTLGYPSSIAESETQDVVHASGEVQSPDVAATPFPSSPRFPSLVQHSATVNPGNSGGPLLDSEGKVVGINTLYSSGDIQNQFYAISEHHAHPMLDALAKGEKKNDPGWKIMDLNDPDLPESNPDYANEIAKTQEVLLKANAQGLFVSSVRTNSPAAEAVVAGDVVTKVKDQRVSTVADLCDILQSSESGEKLGIEGFKTFNADGTNFQQWDPWVSNLTLK
ncbi:trypsin-like peptidase domain-containing protein [Streptomyces sp. DT2A-34]|uniref:S1C family serine protease n=1 Tax=Streptomyces sp. DT2A-34 TaxID=3051182 RepID=UPI00265C5A29|nr:trypsin-like peptidase domain-containing protein [Streptomyces sp. DT2A-34]MDO0912107.1 trypsin-like peptidase domain-containing protein [Streptomyces sp. DT2A-34]